MPRVYVSNDAGYDYKPALDFGELVFVTRRVVKMDDLARVNVNVAFALKESTPDDYLILSGSNLLSTLAALFLYQKHGRIKILHFIRSQNRYECLEITQTTFHHLIGVLGDDRGNVLPQDRPTQ